MITIHISRSILIFTYSYIFVSQLLQFKNENSVINFFLDQIPRDFIISNDFIEVYIDCNETTQLKLFIKSIITGNISIPEAKSVQKDTKSNDDFRVMMEEAEAGVFRSNKTVAPGAVSTKSLGTWEKHTKGKDLYSCERMCKF